MVGVLTFINLCILLQSMECAKFCKKSGGKNEAPHWTRNILMGKCLDPYIQDIPAFEEKKGFQDDAIMYDATWWTFIERDNNKIDHPLSVDLWNYPEQNIVFTNKGKESPEYIFTPYQPPPKDNDGKYHFLRIPITPKTGTPPNKLSESTIIQDWEPKWEHFVWKEIDTTKYGIKGIEGEQLSFPYGIDYEKRDFPMDIKDMTIKKFLNDNMAKQLIEYVDYIQKLAVQQSPSNKQSPLKPIKSEQDTILKEEYYYHPYHARLYKNRWILFQYDDDADKWHIPLLDVQVKVKSVKDVYDQYEFKFFRDKPNKLQIEDVKNKLFYEIWWFPQTRGQCVFHSLQAILQGESLQDGKTNNYQSCNNWVENSQDLLSDFRKPHGKDECKCFIPGRKYANDINLKDIKNKKHCMGAFPLCFVERYLLDKGYKLVVKRKKSLKKDEDWDDSYMKFWNSNDRLHPLGIIMLVPGHVKAFRNIIPREKDGKLRKDKGIWLDLDSGYSPKLMGGVGNIFTSPCGHFGWKDIKTVWLVYDKDDDIKYKGKEWNVIDSGKFWNTAGVLLMEIQRLNKKKMETEKMLRELEKENNDKDKEQKKEKKDGKKEKEEEKKDDEEKEEKKDNEEDDGDDEGKYKRDVKELENKIKELKVELAKVRKKEKEEKNKKEEEEKNKKEEEEKRKREEEQKRQEEEERKKQEDIESKKGRFTKLKEKYFSRDKGKKSKNDGNKNNNNDKGKKANNEYDNYYMIFDDYDHEKEEKEKKVKNQSIFYPIINIMAIFAIYGLILIIIVSFLCGVITTKLIISSNDFNIINDNNYNNNEDKEEENECIV